MFVNKKIIIVNESKVLTQQLKNILKDSNTVILEATNIVELYDVIRSNNGSVDLIVFDISLEYEEGLNLIRQFKDNNDFKKIPIVIVSVYSSRDFVIAAKNLGVKEFIKKPFGKEIILDKFSSIFNG